VSPHARDSSDDRIPMVDFQRLLEPASRDM
jgi:hypothetical protein